MLLTHVVIKYWPGLPLWLGLLLWFDSISQVSKNVNVIIKQAGISRLLVLLFNFRHSGYFILNTEIQMVKEEATLLTWQRILTKNLSTYLEDVQLWITVVVLEVFTACWCGGWGVAHMKDVLIVIIIIIFQKGLGFLIGQRWLGRLKKVVRIVFKNGRECASVFVFLQSFIANSLMLRRLCGGGRVRGWVGPEQTARGKNVVVSRLQPFGAVAAFSGLALSSGFSSRQCQNKRTGSRFRHRRNWGSGKICGGRFAWLICGE